MSSVGNARQREFIEAPHTDGVLLGAPGAGKTFSVIERVLRLLDTGQISGFMVLTFSRAACRDFRRKGNAARRGVFDETNVRTIHSLAGSILGASSQESSLQTAVFRAGELARAGKVPAGMLDGVGVIIVDEAQDVSSSQYALARAVASAARCPLCLVGDPNQNIFQFQGGSDAHLRGHAGWRVQLVENYRSTAAIVDVANAARPSKDFEPMVSASGVKGARPVVFSGYPGEVADRLAATVSDALLKGLTVAVIGPVKKSYKNLNGHAYNMGLQWALHELRRRDVPTKVQYVEDFGDTTDRKDEEASIRPGVAHLFTMHGSKGLEFDVVVVLNFHAKLMGRKASGKELDDFRFLIFVGLTRAKRELTVMRLRGEDVWPAYHELAPFMDTEGEPPELCAPREVEPRPPLVRGWTDLLRDATTLDDRAMAAIEDAMTIETEKHGTSFVGKDLPEQHLLGGLYGLWAENTFYHAYRGETPPCVDEIAAMVNNVVPVPPRLGGAVSRMRSRFGMCPTDVLPADMLRRYGDDIEPELLEFLEENVAALGERDMFLYVRDSCRFFDPLALAEILERARGEISTSDMWLMTLFLWQYRVEAAYRWYHKYDRHLEALRSHAEHIRDVARALPDGYAFQVPVQFDGLPIQGVADAVNVRDRVVLELKFTRDYSTAEGVQAVGYALMLGGDWTVRVFNLRGRSVTDVHSRAIGDPSEVIEVIASALSASSAHA